MLAKEPRILFWDLETSHNIVASFSLWERGRGLSIPHSNVIQERYIITGSWKWAGEKKVHVVTTMDDPERFAANPHDDYFVVKTLHEVISSADVIVAHYGDGYDTKYFRGRALFHGMPPIPPVKTIDTKKVASTQFLLNSNRLDYLGKLLGVGRKIPTSNQWWLDILLGTDEKRRAAIKKMARYNKQDVLLLEDVFYKLRPYMANHINRQLFVGDVVCPKCGSADFEHRGFTHTKTRSYRRFQCNQDTCRGWFSERSALKLPKAA
jgi:ssDNA-binding Zn-finger/Zn-ribbon topoisomerase 1